MFDMGGGEEDGEDSDVSLFSDEEGDEEDGEPKYDEMEGGEMMSTTVEMGSAVKQIPAIRHELKKK